MTDASPADLPNRAGFISPELLLSAIVESSDDAIVSKNLSGIVMSWNPAAERIFGYTAEETVGKSITLIIPEDRSDEEKHILDKIRKGEQVDHFDTVRRRKDGAEVHVSLTISPIRNERGEIVGASKIARNITQRKQAAVENARLYEALERELKQQRLMERALRESEALSTSVLNSSADCIKVMDLEGRLISMNSPGVAAFDLESFDNVKGKLWSELWGIDMRKKVMQAVDRAASGSTTRFNGPCLTAKGIAKWWDVIVTPLRDADGNVNRLTATSRDITEQRKTSDEVLASAAEAERQSRMKDEFLATLSHELRTPLQSILGWTQMLRSGMCEEGELEQGLEVIDRNAHAQTKIIEDLLDMSRILSGKVRLDVQHVQVASVIEAALETVKPAATAKGIRLQAILDPLARPVTGDPARLQQVFWNLLSNAIKFTPRDGRVQISLERVNSHLEVTITDTGCGIEADFLPFVFERFRQADASTTRRHGGLGLGLAIVKHLTELHGGTVRVKSPGAGKGATFAVCLPLAPLHMEAEDGVRRHPEAVNGERRMATPPRLDGISILVVDDEEDARLLIAKMLSKAGAQVHHAGSAKQAIEELKRISPDILISDIGMPEADGYSLIRSVRALPAELGGRVPAIALSAYTRTEDRIRSISEGFQMHLSKPADAMELLAVVQSLFNATRSLRE